MNKVALSTIMTNDHQHCDTFLESVEKYVSEKNLPLAIEALTTWKEINFKHFSIEEEILFPETIKVMQVKIPPIMVMEMEHQQIRNLFLEIEKALSEGNTEQFHRLVDTCIIMIQQHNMKEEQILYPIIDRCIPATNAEIIKNVSLKLSL